MQDADKSAPKSGGLQAGIDGRDLRIGIVQARFNAAITDTLALSCLAELHTLGVEAKHIKHVTVPGALASMEADPAVTDAPSGKDWAIPACASASALLVSKRVVNRRAVVLISMMFPDF